MNDYKDTKELFLKYKADRVIAERDEFLGVLASKEKGDIVIDEHGKEHIVDERGADYIIFRDKDGRRYVSSKLSGDVPKRFFSKSENKEGTV